jgi:alkylhydroperoxidase family enzyme
MSLAVLAGDDSQLPARAASLAQFAATLTAKPWSLDREAIEDLRVQALGDDAIEAAAVVVAMFNYLTRVADASGIEFDYGSPLPAFEPDRCLVPAPRPDRGYWPVIEERHRTDLHLPALREVWQKWRSYVLESGHPLAHRQRQLLARVAAELCCDGWRSDQLRQYRPQDGAESLLVEFAGKLTTQPWSMQADDLDRLRRAGYDETALLHIIAVVALQNADSRLAMALGMVKA